MVFQPPNPLTSSDEEEATSVPRPDVKGDAVVTTANIEVVQESSDDESEDEDDYDPNNYIDQDTPTAFQKDNRGGGSGERCIYVTLYIILFLALGGLAFATVRYVQARQANKQQVMTGDDDDFNEILAARDTDAYKIQLQDILSQKVKASTLLTPSSPQAQAVEWMTFQDSTLVMDDLVLAAESGDPYRVYQRYALMALFFATNGDLWEETPWTDNGEIHECDFLGVDCDESEQIVILDLYLRKLRGRVPDDLGLLTQLSSISLNSNLLEGSIPAVFFDLTKLEYLDLGRNDFSSTLSADIGKLTMLDTLSLGEVSLTGTLPDTMIALTNMRRLRLEQSVMKGPIFNLMEYWPKMEDLDLSLSLFTGTIPTSIGVLNPSLKIV
ncbi:MAG: hypothetical protein SGILL_004099 [Bacillariaceae sp.]